MALRGRGGRSISNSGRPRRPMDWECGDIERIVPAGTKQCEWLIPPSELKAGYTDPTLMSTMVWGQSQMTSTGADASSVLGFGLIVVSAFSDVNPTGDDCPGPLTDCDADWVYLWLAPTAVRTVSTVTYTIGSSDLDRRSQAKRRLGNDKAILLVVESIGSEFAAHYHARCLIKE